MFDKVLKEKIDILKNDGQRFQDIPASVGTDIIVIHTILPILEGDMVIRELPNGITETYIIVNAGYQSEMFDIPAHYTLHVRKQVPTESLKNNAAPKTIPHVQRITDHKRRRLEKLEEQQAIKGINTPPEVLTEIEDLRRELNDLKGG